MRISDWSSDVCSSDLIAPERIVDVDLASEEVRQNFRRYLAEWAKHPPFYVMQTGSPQAVVSRFNDMKEVLNDRTRCSSVPPPERNRRLRQFMPNKSMQIGRASWRERGCQYV